MSFSVQAEDVGIVDYQTEVLDLLNEYGEAFDECFPDLPSDFPSLPDEYLEIDEKINDLSVNKWYHRKITIFGSQLDEIVIHIKHDMSQYVIRIASMYNELSKNFTIYSVNFFDNLEGGVEGDFWNGFSIPQGISEESLREIDVCAETPGFMLISIISALFLVIVGKKYYKKR
jgi:hypothetical protein